MTEVSRVPQEIYLEFYDWPERVAIDNLSIERVPEPGTLLLFGTAAATGFWTRRKNQPRARL